MAKVQFGGGVSEIRGSIAGTTFSRNSSGAYMRQKVTPVNPNTDLQQMARSNFGFVSSGWKGLTQSQRATWIAAAPQFPNTDIFGNSVPLTGSQLYQKLISSMISVGLAAYTTAPNFIADFPENSTSLVTADISDNKLDFTFDSLVGSGFQMKMEATPPYSPGKNFAPNAFRVLRISDADGDFSANYTEKIGIAINQIEAGAAIFVRTTVFNEATGQTMNQLQFKVIVTA